MKKRNHSTNERGFQLLELLLVVALVGLLGSLAIGGLREARSRHRLHAGASAFLAFVTETRVQAMTFNSPLRVVFETNRYALIPADGLPSNWRRLPLGVTFLAGPSGPLTFFPRGNAAPAGSFIISSETGAFRIVVSPGGRVRMERKGDPPASTAGAEK